MAADRLARAKAQLAEAERLATGPGGYVNLTHAAYRAALAELREAEHQHQELLQRVTRNWVRRAKIHYSPDHNPGSG
jgi:hypothetical protein